MKRIVIALALSLSMIAVDASAQSLLKKLGKAVEKEVTKQVTKEVQNQVSKGINKLKEGQQSEEQTQPQAQQSQAQSQTQPASTQIAQSPSQKRTNQMHEVATIDVMVPYGPTKGELGGHQWVDLGLPSGTRWATCNVDATAPEQPGKHYAWGEIATKSSYTDANCTYYSKAMSDISGEKSLDVATAKWGNGWRMPTVEEFSELVHYCDWKYVQKNGRWGVELTSSKNNNSIFLPATGSKEGTSIQEASGCGMYWTSTPLTDQRNGGAHEYHFGGALGEMGVAERFYGYAVRPVTDYDTKIDAPLSGEIAGHKWVDLGLPSGLKWATSNLGTDDIDQDGDHYAWGEVTRYMDKASKKNAMYGKESGDIAGNAQYDAARAQWGGTWRLPTEGEFIELVENCTFEWTSIGRRSGLKVTSKTNGNYIFLPASGEFQSKSDSYGYAHSINSVAAYWTSTPARSDYSNDAYVFHYANEKFIIQYHTRFYGYSIRPVSE